MENSTVLARRFRKVLQGIWLTTVIIFLGTACGVDYGGGGGGADCLPNGPALCGPLWDGDGDTISTNTEQNTTNKVAFGGFYNFDVTKWDINESQARGDAATTGTLFKGMNLT